MFNDTDFLGDETQGLQKQDPETLRYFPMDLNYYFETLWLFWKNELGYTGKSLNVSI